MRRFVLGILLLFTIMLLPACHSQEEPPAENKLSEPHAVSDTPSEPVLEVSSDASEVDDPSDAVTEEEVHSPAPARESSEDTAPLPSQGESSLEEPQAKPVNDLPAETSGTAQPEAPQQTEPLDEEPVSNTPEPEAMRSPEPDPVTVPEQQEQTFHINTWITFAREYGQSPEVGLIYDETAKDCWDNPIIASPQSRYLERDIRSRLELYASDGMTYFCVWAQLRADGAYDLYIGYA